MKKIVDNTDKLRKKPDVVKTFSKLMGSQSPETLFITCSDSRIVPSLITGSGPGEMLVIRNIGNIIPVFSHQDLSTVSALKWAVDVVKVKTIIVCGHTNCGAMKAVLTGLEKKDQALESWLSFAKESLEQHKSVFIGESCDEEDHLSKVNVSNQIQNLKTYPFIKKQILDDNLNIEGWLFNIQKINITKI